MNSDTRRIRIKIGLRDFGIDVPVDDEYIYREAAKEINKIMAVYQSTLVGQDEDFIYLSALHIAVSKARQELSNTVVKQQEMLSDIDQQLSEYIDSAKIK